MEIASLCLVKTQIDLNASYEVAITENPANSGTSASSRKKRAAIRHTHFWAPGRTLRIAFLNGDQAFKDAVKTAANNWLPHINLNFEFVEGKGVISALPWNQASTILISALAICW